MLTVAALTCPICNDTIYSHTRHDMRRCSCAAISIDGGFDYVKISHDPYRLEYAPELKTLSLPHTLRELYVDWNEKLDKFGLIKKASL